LIKPLTTLIKEQIPGKIVSIIEYFYAIPVKLTVNK